jgi:uncharacterized protein YecE (DUF72 family)
MGDVVVGTCSWTDKTMIERWYPRGVNTAEARLRYYAARFDTVEVDSSFYGIPKPEVAENWAKRTPECFTFHVKAFGLMTGHDVDERALHPDLREYGYELTSRGRVRHPDERMYERSFELFLEAIEPLRRAHKMGGVLMQYPPYFQASDPAHTTRNLETIERAVDLLKPLPVFVEFRHASWVEGPQLAQTMRFLSDRFLTYVAVDEPQIPGAHVMPPISAATSPLGYVRFHGRNAGMWNARTASAADRFDYLYSPDELAGWDEPIHRLADETERTWVMFNNCKYDYAPRNAREMAEILGDVVAPRLSGVGETGEAVPDESHAEAVQSESPSEESGAGFTGTLF